MGSMHGQSQNNQPLSLMSMCLMVFLVKQYQDERIPCVA